MSSTSYLLRLTEAAELLGLTGPGAARRWLEQNKVPMIDYGPGRGLGPRWPRDSIVEAINANLVYQPGAEPKRRKKASRPITGRSTRELIAELASPRDIQ
ncbi:MAG: hypothetical protein P4L39_02910 [Humidesulfovibrio sp.]|nr:hypothetical protein [Humidesulfovibrio sp.]